MTTEQKLINLIASEVWMLMQINQAKLHGQNPAIAQKYGRENLTPFRETWNEWEREIEAAAST